MACIIIHRIDILAPEPLQRPIQTQEMRIHSQTVGGQSIVESSTQARCTAGRTFSIPDMRMVLVQSAHLIQVTRDKSVSLPLHWSLLLTKPHISPFFSQYCPPSWQRCRHWFMPSMHLSWPQHRPIPWGAQYAVWSGKQVGRPSRVGKWKLENTYSRSRGCSLVTLDGRLHQE